MLHYITPSVPVGQDHQLTFVFFLHLRPMGSGPCAKGWPCTRPSSKTPKSACALAAVQIRIFDDLSRVGFLKIFVGCLMIFATFTR